MGHKTHRNQWNPSSSNQERTIKRTPMLDGCEIHFAPPFRNPGMIRFQRKYQPTLWFQPWFQSGANGFRPSTVGNSPKWLVSFWCCLKTNQNGLHLRVLLLALKGNQEGRPQLWARPSKRQPVNANQNESAIVRNTPTLSVYRYRIKPTFKT